MTETQLRDKLDSHEFFVGLTEEQAREMVAKGAYDITDE